MPDCRRPLALSAVAGALAFGTPALAQSETTIDYARPAPEGAVTFHSDPVVQPLPGQPAPPPPPEDYFADEPQAPLPPPPPIADHHSPMAAPLMDHVPGYAGGYAPPPAYGAPYLPHGYAAAPARLDREAWLDECHDRIRGVDPKDRAGVIGGLLGAAAGGVIGNRAWESERLAGTLLGAGVGGLAGIAVGSAVEGAHDRGQDDECALHLDRYMAAGYPGAGYPYAPYGYDYPRYGYGGGYAMVPVMVAIPQRQVVRETVTEEWVDEPVRNRSIEPRHRTAPRPDKRIRYSK